MKTEEIRFKDIEPITKEQFAIQYHHWAMKVGFIGFDKADDNQKIIEFKKFLKSKER